MPLISPYSEGYDFDVVHTRDNPANFSSAGDIAT
jgi:hypothetical protein